MMRKNLPSTSPQTAILGVVAMGLLVGSLLVGQTNRTASLEQVIMVRGLELKTLRSFPTDDSLTWHLARQLPLLAITRTENERSRNLAAKPDTPAVRCCGRGGGHHPRFCKPLSSAAPNHHPLEPASA